MRFLMFYQWYKPPTIFNGENIRTLPDRFLEIIHAINKAPSTARKKISYYYLGAGSWTGDE